MGSAQMRTTDHFFASGACGGLHSPSQHAAGNAARRVRFRCLRDGKGCRGGNRRIVGKTCPTSVAVTEEHKVSDSMTIVETNTSMWLLGKCECIERCASNPVRAIFCYETRTVTNPDFLRR